MQRLTGDIACLAAGQIDYGGSDIVSLAGMTKANVADTFCDPSVTVPLEAALKALGSADAAMVYACGPEPMLEAVAKLAAAYHQPSQVSVERVMGCGLGGCYSCVVPVKHGTEEANLVRSCISGPVFDGAELVWD